MTLRKREVSRGMLRGTGFDTVAWSEEVAVGHGRAEETRRSFPLLATQSDLRESPHIDWLGCTADAVTLGDTNGDERK